MARNRMEHKPEVTREPDNKPVEPETTPEPKTPEEAIKVAMEDPTMYQIQIFSREIETKPAFKNGQKIKVVQGEVNGEKFTVECDTPASVPKWVYEALLPLIKKQRGEQHWQPDLAPLTIE